MKRLLTVTLFVLLAAVVAFGADVAGTWKASMPGREGATMEVTFNFKVDGEKLTGTMTTQMGDTEISDGKVAGDTITFKVKREFNGNTMIMLYEGKVSGAEIKFKSTREGSDRPPREFVAKKA